MFNGLFIFPTDFHFKVLSEYENIFQNFFLKEK